MEFVSGMMTHARVDSDGFITALINGALVPNLEHQPNTVPAPVADPAPGYVWRWDEDLGWRQSADRRGARYINPLTGERMVITGLLQEPPTGFEPVTLGVYRLAELRESMHARIEHWRDAQESESILFDHDGRTWDGGIATRQRLQPVISLAALPEGFIWTDAGNDDVPMDLAGLAALNAAHEAALVAQGFRIHLRQRQMKGEIETMTLEQLEGFEPGWPPAP